MTRRAWYPALQILVAVLVLLFLGRYLAGNWAEIRHSGDALRIDAAPLAVATAIVLATYAMLIAAWRAVLLGWGERLPYADAARIWCLSNLARYLPGRVWQIAGMAAMAQRAGVSPWAAAGSAVVIQLLAIATGALVTAALAPSFGHPLLIGVAGGVTAAGAAVLAWPAPARLLARTLSRVTGRTMELRSVQGGPLALSAAITAAAWAAYGLALLYSVDGLVGRQSLDARAAIGVFTGSYLAGLINVFTPGGLGTREVILVNWLTGPLGPAAATVVTVGSRLLMTATEVLAALITLSLPTQSADGT
ncbi:MAG: flippase-like domain-containing protein [Gemmatimonadetes bacterium]|nr:flippase-like domain-containing protein [Gemmatimonadota bacterium]